jgi:hypothetical protein
VQGTKDWIAKMKGKWFLERIVPCQAFEGRKTGLENIGLIYK